MIRSLLIAVLTACLLPPMQARVAAAPAPPQAAAAQYAVVLILDGAQPGYFRRPALPHVQALIASGTRYTNAWTGILESETPSAHAAIGSGVEPRKNGILGFSWADPSGHWLDLLNEQTVRGSVLETQLRQAHAPSLAADLHAHDRTGLVAAVGGYKYYAQDAVGGPDANVIMYYSAGAGGRLTPEFIPGHAPPLDLLLQPTLVAPSSHLSVGGQDHLAAKLAVATFNRLRPRVLFVNFPEFDQPLGHIWGASRDPVDVERLMQQFDADLASIEDAYRRAGVLSKTTFFVTADHGFAPITYAVPKPSVFRDLQSAGIRTINTVWHTAAYLWLQNPARGQQAAEIITKEANPYVQSVYYQVASGGTFEYHPAGDLGQLPDPAVDAANRYLLASFAGPDAPAVVVFFTEEAAGVPHRNVVWKGDHGGADWESQHIPLIISGAGVRAGKVSFYPARLIDLAPTVLSLLGASSADMQGIPLADALTAPASTTLAQQQTESRILHPLVNALKKESVLELAQHR